MKPIPLFGQGVNSYSSSVTAQRRLNCFYDIRQDGDKQNIIIRGTPGSSIWITLPTYPVRGWWLVGGYLYVVSGAIVYKVASDGTYTSLATPLGHYATAVSMADNGTQLMIVDGHAGYIVTLATGVISTIIDANFPNGATTVAFLNGRFVVEKAGSRQYYVSQSYDGMTWTPVVFATKENWSDNIIAVSSLNGNLILFGTDTMEFWQDSGGASLPYTRINGATQTWGLAAVLSRSPIANTMAFLAKNQQGTVEVVMLNGYTPQVISTSDINNIINGFSVYSDAVSMTYVVDGHAMYQITFPTANRSFLYDTSTNMWFETQTGVSELNRHFANYGISFNAINYATDSTTGNIYKLSQNTYTDNGTAIKRQVISRHVNNGGNSFGISELWLDMETGVGTVSGSGSDPKIMMQMSKDGGHTFGKEEWKSIGKIGEYRYPRVIWRRLGIARDFVFKFTTTDPVKFIIISGSAKLSGQEGADG